jgi:ectoine hydroxylase
MRWRRTVEQQVAVERHMPGSQLVEVPHGVRPIHDRIRLLEPCDHLHERLAALFEDERLVAPVRAELGIDGVAPFTSKLNLKRAAEGSEFPWHQDSPYWYVAVGDDAQDVVTAIVFLDDTTADNGAVRVVPGSHVDGPVRRDPDDPTRFLTDPGAVDA